MLQDKANGEGGKGHCVCWCVVLMKELKIFLLFASFFFLLFFKLCG